MGGGGGYFPLIYIVTMLIVYSNSIRNDIPYNKNNSILQIKCALQNEKIIMFIRFLL